MGKLQEKILKFFFASLKSMKTGIGSGVGSGSMSQRYESGDEHQHVTNTQHCLYYKHQAGYAYFMVKQGKSIPMAL